MKKKVTEFPFESVRRITANEVAAAREAVKAQFDIEPPLREPELASGGVSAVQSDTLPSFEDALLEKYKDQLNG